MAAPNPMQKTAYHIINGATVMYEVDANNAIASFPKEWSATPWPVEEMEAARAEAGMPPMNLSASQQKAVSDEEKKRQEAIKIVEDADKKAAAEQAEQQKVAEARAYLAHPPIVSVEPERQPEPAPAPKDTKAKQDEHKPPPPPPPPADKPKK